MTCKLEGCVVKEIDVLLLQQKHDPFAVGLTGNWALQEVGLLLSFAPWLMEGRLLQVNDVLRIVLQQRFFCSWGLFFSCGWRCSCRLLCSCRLSCTCRLCCSCGLFCNSGLFCICGLCCIC